MYNSYVNLPKIFRKLSSIFYSQYLRFQSNSSLHIANQKGIDLSSLLSKSSFIHGMISFDEAKTLFFLSSLGSIEGDVLEIGSWLGRSTTFLAMGCKVSGNGVVHAIDTFKGNPGKESMYESPLETEETILDKFNKNIKQMGLSKYVKTYNMSSEKAHKKIKGRFRLVFIDGCHEYEAVKKDIQMWEQRLSKGGLMALHDYSKFFKGSQEAINELLLDNKYFLPLLLSDSLIVFKKKEN